MANFGERIGIGITPDDYIDFDQDVSTNEGILTEQEILAQVISQDDDDQENEMFDEERLVKPGIIEVRNAIEILEKFSLFSRFGEQMMRPLNMLDRFVDKEEQHCKKQTTIHDFFAK